MAPPLHLNTHGGVPYTPTSDALDRHEFGVSKNRKMTSAGGGRTWSEDEEVYLLQTRLQKMPYKHIAAHLKKTELACRLHYHQLSHGSNRRKRTASMSSGSSSGQSPVLSALDTALSRESSRDATPPRSASSHEPSSPDFPTPIRLPRILPSTNASPRLPTILPKPAAMLLPTTTTTTTTTPPALSFPAPKRSLDPSPFPLSRSPRLRLDCTLPPPSVQVDMPRLQAIYAAHRSSFWGAITADYGAGVSPIVLEQAWKASISAGPITPAPSPRARERPCDRTRISAILDDDGGARGEGVRRLGGERCASA
ncbi:hypothetical protein F4861DRAFT_386151 [Xylaria intraflava]|nr:hypothetical protein F4861DRAFT_386151 [Xylaria intraflava]